MTLTRLDHFNVVTACPDETLRFYCDGLGLVNDPDRRPDFGVPGAWLFAGDAPLVHLAYVDEDPGGQTGPINHIAFAGEDREAICARLDSLDIAYKLVEQPAYGFSQVFVIDPNGVKVEINIAA